MSDSLLTTRSIEMIFSVKWESKLTVSISQGKLFHTQIGCFYYSVFISKGEDLFTVPCMVQGSHSLCYGGPGR